MILSDLLEVVSLGARGPFFLFSKELSGLIENLLPKIEDMVEALEESETRSHLRSLHTILSTQEIDEYRLAQILVEISGIFVGNTPGDKMHIVATFQKELSVFYRRAQVFYTYKEKRAQISERVGHDDLRLLDKKLASTIGMMYVLEYLLLLYKYMDEATSMEDKMQFVVSRTLKLPEGEFPGLWFDFSTDEILTKFILDIFDDEYREMLVRAFYRTRDVLLEIDVECDLQGQCSAAYPRAQVHRVQDCLKQMIGDIIEVYRSMGIDRLSSVFLVPYGEKTKLIDLPFY